MTDLSLVSVDALVKELRSRAIHFVFGHIVRSEDTASKEEYFLDWSGSMFACLGLIEAIHDDIRAQVRQVEAQGYSAEA